MSFWKESFKIGNCTIPRFIGGPMVGFTDSPFRALVRQFSPKELLYTELSHATNIVYAHDKSDFLRFEQIERPLNFQLTVNTPDYIDRACEHIVSAGVDMVDLNIGCPARNVVGSGSGSALMADLPLLKEILKKFRAALPIPFTVKMRAGFKEQNCLDVARLAQDEGVDALVVHPRLQTQKFSGNPEYCLVAQIKKEASIPIIISGEVVDVASACSLYEKTGVDGFMVSRAFRGVPWKLRELQEGVEGRDYSLTSDQKGSVAVSHLERMLDYYGPGGLYLFRKHLAFYLKDRPDAGRYRRDLMTEESAEVVKEKLKEFFRICSECSS